MSFADLSSRHLSDYLTSERDPDAFWLFLHIPKTAGSSFSEELASRVPPYSNIFVDYSDEETPFDQRLDHAVERFLQRQAVAPFHSASGHLPFPLCDKIRRHIPNTKLVTFLRDPVARVVSDFRYQRTPLHPPFETFKEQFPTLMDYVASPDSQNKMAQFMAWQSDDGDAALEARLNDFAFIGLLEMYPMSFGCIFDLMGHPGQLPQVHRRQTPQSADTDVELGPDLVQEILRTNQDDVRLHQAVKSALLPKREEWRDRLEAERVS